MQMNLLGWQVILLWVVGLTVFVRVYGRMILHIQDRGGEVRAKLLQFPDTLVALVLMFFFTAQVVELITKPEAPNVPTQTEAAPPINVIGASLTMAAIPMVVVFFMIYRKLPIVKIFGLRRLGGIRVFVNSLALLLAAVPAVFLCHVLTQQLLGENGEPQMLVELFHSAKDKGDLNTLWQITISAVVIAPIAEEVLFRGYFYPALKRHIGGVHSAWITAALFAGIHGNLAGFAGLTVLALTLTIAFERTGSLLVSIIMHAGHNAITVMAMWHMTNPIP